MKNNKHTPTPWMVVPSSKKGNGTAWREIHSVGGGGFSPAYIGEALEWDAYLMASSPDILSALEALTDWGCTYTSPNDPNSPHTLLIAARAAIAKARGSV
jgi:hypothetical protein